MAFFVVVHLRQREVAGNSNRQSSRSRLRQAGVSRLVSTVAEVMVEEFGSFLVLEVWSGPPATTEDPITTADLRPRFRFVSQRGASKASVADAFGAALRRVRLQSNCLTPSNIFQA